MMIDLENMGRAAKNTWDLIAHDVLTANEGTLSKGEVIEYVIQHMDTYGNLNESDLNDWNDLQRSEQLKLCEMTFVHEEYCL